MEIEGLVSIIIPVYNRKHLIGQTLESVLSQTYEEWECLVIDDGSIDGTEEVVQSFVEKDSRFQLHKRPVTKPKGANSCRNYGFELSNGEFVKWFDSDDIMLPIHLESLILVLQAQNVDFVVGDSRNFVEGKEINKKPFDFNRTEAIIDAEKFAKHEIGWITDDFLGLKKIVTGIDFNENLKAGQEYNFFIRLLLQNQNGFLLDQILTKARLHQDSLSSNTQKKKEQHQKIIAEIKLLTLEDIYRSGNNRLNKWFLSGYIQIAFTLALKKIKPPYLCKGFCYVRKLHGLNKAISFVLSLNMAYLFEIGYAFNKYSRK